jgi:RNA polymerase sigma-70 factor (ECF subfamily)
METHLSQPDLAINRFREYLLLMARLHLEARPRQKLDPSDIVQQTLLEACQNLHQFRGRTDAELAGWLRRALAHNLADALRATGRAKRNVALERSLEAAWDQSSARLGALLQANHSTPSQQAARNEDLLRLAKALTMLPDSQREAIVLHHLQGWTLLETAQRLSRSETSVAGLLHRGLKKLRQLLDDPE